MQVPFFFPFTLSHKINGIIHASKDKAWHTHLTVKDFIIKNHL